MPRPRYIFYRCLGLSLTLSFCRPETIGRLSDDVLLNIFHYYLDPSPRFWPRLVHICRAWRRLVFASQQALHLRLFCAPGTPVLKTLDCWPVLPIVIEYGGSLEHNPPAPEDEVNIIAALKESGRVSSISLSVTTSLLEKLYAIERPFLELEDLVLLSRDSVRQTLPRTFRCGPRLRRLHLTKIFFIPEHLHLLRCSKNLVDLQLHEVGGLSFPMFKFMDVLSGMTQLRSLSLHFPATTARVFPPPQPDQCFTLPALTRLDFRGTAEYLEYLVIRIDAPDLGDIQIALLDKSALHDPSRFGKFICRTGVHKSHYQAHILSYWHNTSISLTQPGAPTCLKLQVFSELLSDRLSVMSRIFLHFPVEDLRITLRRLSSPADEGRWLVLINSFTGVKSIHLDGAHWRDIVDDFQGVNWRHKTVLPALHKLYLPRHGPRHEPLPWAIVSFMTSRWRSGYPIVGVEYERLYRISELRGTGTSLHIVPLHHVRTSLKQDLFRASHD
jgi:hypothetical protein